MNTLLIKYVHDVANYGSITRAAQMNFISPSHLSRQIKELEEDLGVTLFDRSVVGMHLTKQGWDFISWTKPILESVESFEMHFHIDKDVPQEAFSFRIALHHNTATNQAIVKMINDKCREQAYVDIIADSFNSLNETLNAMSQYNYLAGVIQYNNDNRRRVQNRLQAEQLQEVIVHRSAICVLMADDHPLAHLKKVDKESLEAYPRIYYIDEELSNFFDITNRQNLDFSAVQKRILIKERGQLFHFIHSTQAYYIGTYRCPDCSEHRRMVSIPLATDHESKVVTSVVFPHTVRNNANLLEFITILRGIFSGMEEEYKEIYCKD